MKLHLLTGFICYFLMIESTLDKPAYILYDRSGQPITYSSMVQSLDTIDIILFGEIHNNALAHWLELQVMKSIFEQRSNLVIGAEMFEADDQIILDEYLLGLIEDSHLESEAKLWNNYHTDYKPLLHFAKKYQLPFIATNIPRRYASLVARQGLDALQNLSDTALSYMAPLPIAMNRELVGYQNMLDMMGSESDSAHGNFAAMRMVEAQMLKDATMAYFISQHLPSSDGKFIHYNGSYHSDHYEGIYWYLKKILPTVKIATISCVEQKDITKLSKKDRHLADFIIAIPEDMAKTN